MAVLWRWPFDKLVKTVVATLLNSYDMFMVVEGSTGVGKSSFALHLAIHVKREFKRLMAFDYETVNYYYERLKFEQKGISHEDFLAVLVELKRKDAYTFKMSESLIYKQDEMKKFLSEWCRIGIPDEMINVTFNRDFFHEDQKDIIKMINMFRDHLNLIIACVPNFGSLDKQIKDLCKIRISVVRRGLALIQTPNKTFYGKDKWDTQFNEKIEREWLMNKTKKPQYTRLTTFRGLIRFPKLPPKTERKYQKIKNKKRSVILKDEMGISDKKELTVEEKLYNKMIKGGIKNMQIIEGVAMANDMTMDKLRASLRRMLEAEGKDPKISSYFWNKKAIVKEEKDKDFKKKIDNLKDSL